VDRYQIEEWNHHWANSLADYKGDMVNVLAAVDFADKLTSVNIFNGSGDVKKKNVNMEDIKVPVLDTGFYDIAESPAIYSRKPTRQTIKGLNSHNSTLRKLYVDGGKIWTEALPFTWDRMIYVWNQAKTSVKENKKDFGSKLESLRLGYLRGFSLNRDYCVMHAPRKTALSDVAVCGLSGIVARVIDVDSIAIRPSIAYVSESVKAAIGDKFGFIPKEAKNV
jgi:hypothetical protein